MTKNINELESQDGIEKIVKNAEEASKNTTVEKGQRALQQQFEYLIKRVFGESTSCNYFSPYNNSSVGSDKRYDAGIYWHVYKSRSFFEAMAGAGRLIRISPESENKLLIRKDHTYGPITLTVFDSESLNKAKIFAAAYKELSGEEVILVQECSVAEEMNSLVEKFGEEKPKRVNKPLEAVIKFSDGKEMAVSKEHWINEFDTFIKNIFSKYSVEQDTDTEWDIYKITGKGFFGGKKSKYVGRIKRTSWPGAESWKLAPGYDHPFEIEVYNDTITKEVLTFVKEIEAQLEREVKITRTEAK